VAVCPAPEAVEDRVGERCNDDASHANVASHATSLATAIATEVMAIHPQAMITGSGGNHRCMA